MSCHRTVEAGSPQIATLRRAHQAGAQIAWNRVYKVPDFVFFNHAKHTNGGVACAECHGSVETRDVLAKEAATSMNSCMSCHARKQASIACNVCHDLGQ